MCVRGFQEDEYPQSDSPTASQDSIRLLLTIAANEEFTIHSHDVASAFLQGTPLDRDVYMEPPIEAKNVGFVWKLKKGAYGLYDTSRKWYLAVKKELVELGMQ